MFYSLLVRQHTTILYWIFWHFVRRRWKYCDVTIKYGVKISSSILIWYKVLQYLYKLSSNMTSVNFMCIRKVMKWKCIQIFTLFCIYFTFPPKWLLWWPWITFLQKGAVIISIALSQEKRKHISLLISCML